MTRNRRDDGTYANEEIRARLFSRATRRGGCLEWDGPRTAKGYGRLHFEGRNQMAHRVAWAVTNGPVPAGLFVCHRCDNPACVEPAHLFLGTNHDNVTDMIQKGRKRPARGEAVNTAKLTGTLAAEIRLVAEQEGVGSRALGLRYGLHHSTIARVLNGQRWRSE